MRSAQATSCPAAACQTSVQSCASSVSRKAATAYLNFLYSPEGQEIIAKHNFRPRDPAVLKKHASRFPAIKTFTVEEKFGSWDAVQKTHFSDGGIYDQIVVKR